MYTLLIIGAIVIVAAGVPAVELLLRWIRPLTPEQEERRRRLDEARSEARAKIDWIPR